VSAPFHCALMRPAAEHVAHALQTIQVKPLAFDVFSNVEGRANSDSARVPELLVRQIDGAVLWEQTLRGMVSAGITHALELGPGQVLAGLAKKTDKSLKVLSVQDAAGIQLVSEFLAS
jgi:[acyl-carrier-protein] S-malonyltransferase